MSDKSNKYGYVGVDIPAQSFGSNKGVFNPAEINDLVANNQWTTFGQLELIETQTVSASTTADFTSLGSYNVHFLTINDVDVATDDDRLQIRFSNDGGSTFETTNYQYANQAGESDGTFNESRTTTGTSLITTCLTGNATNEKGNGYIYLYNLSDSSKYSFQTWQSNSIRGNTNLEMRFGSGVYTVAETINAIRLFSNAGTNFSSTISLYGIRYS